jgi:hypothetical protein
VHTAGDAETALLLLADLRPTRSDGRPTAAWMSRLGLPPKADPVHKDVRIIALNAYAMKGDGKRHWRLR